MGVKSFKRIASRKTPEVTSVAEEEPVAPQSAPESSNLPLFFKKPAVLDKARHASSTISPQGDALFAKLTNSIAINALEFIEAGKFYPIVFTSGDVATPLAIVGLEQENYFIDAKDQWREGTYIPAYVRQYPFIFLENADEQKFYLCIDEQSSRFKAKGEKDGRVLFNEDGSLSPLTSQALEFCTAYYQHHAITLQFTADLVKHKLLQPYQSQATLPSGRKVSLSGFSMIDEKAVNALSDEIFKEFRTKGWLPFIYLALASSSNWARLANLPKA